MIRPNVKHIHARKMDRRNGKQKQLVASTTDRRSIVVVVAMMNPLRDIHAGGSLFDSSLHSGPAKNE